MKRRVGCTGPCVLCGQLRQLVREWAVGCYIGPRSVTIWGECKPCIDKINGMRGYAWY